MKTLETGLVEVARLASARADAAEAEVARLREDLTATRVSHAKLMRTIKAALGYQHWPIIKGNVVDGVCALLLVEITALRARCWDVRAITNRALAAEARCEAAEAEVKRREKYMADGEAAYVGSAVMCDVFAFFEAAGCGKPGTPNTLWSMTQEIVARALVAQRSLDEARAEVERLARLNTEIHEAKDASNAALTRERDEAHEALWIEKYQSAELTVALGAMTKERDEAREALREWVAAHDGRLSGGASFKLVARLNAAIDRARRVLAGEKKEDKP